MGPTQLADVLRQLPRSVDPSLLVGFENSDDAGVFRLSDRLALVQTVDFFTPIVDDPYAYGQIAAANALSDIYAMGGRPITVLNIACFDPSLAPPDVWAAVLKGAHDKTVESGAVIMGGHSVEDDEPKFGMAVTGLIDPTHMFVNTEARPGDQIWLSKPLGTGIVTTAAKADSCDPEVLTEAIRWMSMLNADARDAGLAARVRCATDITGFGLAGHLYNVARASKVAIHLNLPSLPVFEGVEALIAEGHTTGGATKNRDFLGPSLEIRASEFDWRIAVALDPQTSGGLATFSPMEIPGSTWIGEVKQDGASVYLHN